MAWTSTVDHVSSVPFLIKRITVVPDSTTATAITHGGPEVTPDMVLIEPTHVNPTATEITVTAKGTTTVTFDVEGSGARFIAYVFWFNQARQDGQSINQDNAS